jgi:hypothetical protein
MKIVFEGSIEQIKNLKLLVIENDNDLDLPTPREDYQTENLWCINDVIDNYHCPEEQALDLLENALTNEATMNQIWFALEVHAEAAGFERRKDSENFPEDEED